MKKLTVFETSVIGFFVGVLISTYIVFLMGTDGYVGKILSIVSLQSILSIIKLSDAQLLTGSFLFFILVYTVYGALIGLIIKFTESSRKIGIALLLLVCVGGLEQFFGGDQHIVVSSQQEAAVVTAVPKRPQQYFGTDAAETTGDLNADGKSDIAFILERTDMKKPAYYVAASLASQNGHTGTNFLYLGDDALPQNILITNGMIDVSYLSGTATSTHHFYTRVIDGSLKKISISSN